jgi:thymidylate synthase (FAD)
MQGFGEQTVHDATFKHQMHNLDLYRDMIDRGVAPEQARMVLPQSMMTEWYWSGSLDAFASMCALRCKPDTQYETQLVANQIDDIMSTLFPVSWQALRMYEE